MISAYSAKDKYSAKNEKGVITAGAEKWPPQNDPWVISQRRGMTWVIFLCRKNDPRWLFLYVE